MIISGSIHLTESLELSGTNLKVFKTFRPDEEDGVVEVEGGNKRLLNMYFL